MMKQRSEAGLAHHVKTRLLMSVRVEVCLFVFSYSSFSEIGSYIAVHAGLELTVQAELASSLWLSPYPACLNHRWEPPCQACTASLHPEMWHQRSSRLT